MTVKFNMIERANPPTASPEEVLSHPLKPADAYPCANCCQCRRKSTLTQTDIIAAIEALLAIIPEELAKGNVVELGDFGSFWLRINAEGADNEGMVHTGNITGVLPRFIPGKEFKNPEDDRLQQELTRLSHTKTGTVSFRGSPCFFLSACSNRRLEDAAWRCPRWHNRLEQCIVLTFERGQLSNDSPSRSRILARRRLRPQVPKM